MPRKKAVVEAPVVEEAPEPVEAPAENPLVARRQELLDLLAVLDRNGFKDKGQIEVELSIVNRDLEAGR